MKHLAPWVILGLAILYSWAYLDGRSYGRAEAVGRQADAALLLAGRANRDRWAALRASDSVSARVAQMALAARQAAERARVAAGTAQAAREALAAAQGAADSLPALVTLAGALESEVWGLRRVIQADSGIVAALEGDRARLRAALEAQGAAADSLGAALEAYRRATGCRLGVGPLSLGCPSRRTALLAGLVLGAGAVLIAQ